MATACKRFKDDKPKRIGTHNGTFHCDEVLACYMLLKLFPDVPVTRTRDPAELSLCDVVVDVGGVYSPQEGRFDHHQRSFSLSMNSLDASKAWSTKLSSAGLVYHHFGRPLISQLVGTKVSEETVELLWDRMYEKLVHSVDAIDNGVPVAEGELNYLIQTDLSSRVASLNPAWNDPRGADDHFIMSRFDEAMAMVGKEFESKLSYLWESWLPARQLVKEAYEGRFEVHGSGEVMLLQKGSCPWKEHLSSLEQQDAPLVKYVLYTDTGGAWRLQCVPVEAHSFVNRLGLPEEWRGLRDEELSRQVGVEGCVFVHASGFIGGHRSKEGVLCMATKALELACRQAECSA